MPHDAAAPSDSISPDDSRGVRAELIGEDSPKKLVIFAPRVRATM